MKLTRNERLKIRYQLLRKAGYSAKEANKLKHLGSKRGVDVKSLKINPKTKQVVKNQSYHKIVKELKVVSKVDQVGKIYDNYNQRVQALENDTILTKWGMLTHDERYKDDVAKHADRLQKQFNWDNDQAYFFLYFMTENNMSFKETYQTLTAREDFEQYQKQKKARIELKRKRKRS